jgi:nucleoside-diphosphate-sugar epimerase
MNHILITGATGFIGSHAIESALASGFRVTALARSPVLEPLPGVEYRQVDLFDAEQVSNLFSSIHPSNLLHVAWVVNPVDRWTSPENDRWVVASKVLLREFAEAGGQRAVVTGSCAEYDWSAAQPCDEMTTPTCPGTLYGRCKNELREWAMEFGHRKGVNVAWGRLFFLHGPREHPDRLVPSVINALIENRPVACTAGTQKRDYMCVSDAADALITLLQSDITGPVNIASGSATSVRELVEYVAGALGRLDLVQFGARPTPPSEPPLLVANINRLIDELEWRPRYSLNDGLDATIRWWKNERTSSRRDKPSHVLDQQVINANEKPLTRKAS